MVKSLINIQIEGLFTRPISEANFSLG